MSSESTAWAGKGGGEERKKEKCHPNSMKSQEKPTYGGDTHSF